MNEALFLVFRTKNRVFGTYNLSSKKNRNVSSSCAKTPLRICPAASSPTRPDPHPIETHVFPLSSRARNIQPLSNHASASESSSCTPRSNITAGPACASQQPPIAAHSNPSRREDEVQAPPPSKADVRRVLESVGAAVEEDRLDLLLAELEGKDLAELIAAGRGRRASAQRLLSARLVRRPRRRRRRRKRKRWRRRTTRGWALASSTTDELASERCCVGARLRA
jgi:hypothetical protein